MRHLLTWIFKKTIYKGNISTRDISILWMKNNSCHINKTKNVFEEHFATCNKWREKRKQQYQRKKEHHLGVKREYRTKNMNKHNVEGSKDTNK